MASTPTLVRWFPVTNSVQKKTQVQTKKATRKPKKKETSRLLTYLPPQPSPTPTMATQPTTLLQTSNTTTTATVASVIEGEKKAEEKEVNEISTRPLAQDICNSSLFACPAWIRCDKCSPRSGLRQTFPVFDERIWGPSPPVALFFETAIKFEAVATRTSHTNWSPTKKKTRSKYDAAGTKPAVLPSPSPAQ